VTKKAGNTVACHVVLTTLGSKADAQSLVRRLVSERLVACGTIVESAYSVYEWEGRLEETPEVLVILKTRMELWGRLQSVVHELHPYDVPELLAIPVAQGLPAYLGWLAEQTTEEQK
jgi:periplasmic divalent cation tolerance protein